MKKTSLVTFAAALGAIALAACDSAPPSDSAGPRPVSPEQIAPGETLSDVVRERLAGILRDEDPYSRARRLGALIPTLGPEFVPEVKKTLNDPTLDLGGAEIELLVRYWATYEPRDATRWAVMKSPHGFRVSAVLAALTPWAEADPHAARKAAEEFALIPQRREVYEAMQIAVVSGWYKTNPSELTKFIQDLGVGIGRQRGLATFIRVMVQNEGAEAVIRWAESRPDDDAAYKTSVYRQLGGALMLFDREAGIRWCEAHCDGPYGNNLRNVIGRRWAQNDGAAALEWLSSAPDGHEKKIALRAAFAEWGQADPRAALAWMAARTTGELDPWLRPIIPVYARLLAQESPADAIEWAERTEDAEEREVLLIKIARKWRERDAAAAEAWLAESPLSEEAREKARAPEPPRGPQG
jgi:hypothetical protein